jgi:hypothetical protein
MDGGRSAFALSCAGSRTPLLTRPVTASTVNGKPLAVHAPDGGTVTEFPAHGVPAHRVRHGNAMQTRRESAIVRTMDRAAFQTYAERDWATFERLLFRERAAKFRKEGPRATIRASRELWKFARSLRRAWPPERARAADLAHHVAFKRRLDRIARAFPVR